MMSSQSNTDRHIGGTDNPVERGKKWPCDYCNVVAKSEYGLRKHTSTFHIQNYFKCDVCSETFSTEKEMVEHLDAIHSLLGYKCETCGTRFKIKETKEKHEVIHMDHSLICGHCSLSLTNVYGIFTHQKLCHNIVDSFKCDFARCTSTFKRIYDLTRHVKTVHQDSSIIKRRHPDADNVEYEYDDNFLNFVYFNQFKIGYIPLVLNVSLFGVSVKEFFEAFELISKVYKRNVFDQFNIIIKKPGNVDEILPLKPRIGCDKTTEFPKVKLAQQLLNLLEVVSENMKHGMKTNKRGVYYQLKSIMESDKRTDSIIDMLCYSFGCDPIDLNITSSSKGIWYRYGTTGSVDFNPTLDYSDIHLIVISEKFHFLSPILNQCDYNGFLLINTCGQLSDMIKEFVNRLINNRVIYVMVDADYPGITIFANILRSVPKGYRANVHLISCIDIDKKTRVPEEKLQVIKLLILKEPLNWRSKIKKILKHPVIELDDTSYIKRKFMDIGR